MLDGRSVDTTMGFTPLEGLVMATRSGTVDPGLVLWLEEHEHLSPHEVAAALESRSGLLALAGTGDMREVEEHKHRSLHIESHGRVLERRPMPVTHQVVDQPRRPHRVTVNLQPDCSPRVDTRAAQITSASPAACLTRSTVISLRNTTSSTRRSHPLGHLPWPPKHGQPDGKRKVKAT